MKKIAFLVLIFSLIIIAPSVLAAPKLSLPVRSTWDSDMIDIDQVSNTGKGVYVAVLDTGLTPNWKDYFPTDRIASKLGKGFTEDVMWDEKTDNFIESGVVHEAGFIGDTGSTHGTHVTSTIIGYNYYSPADAAAGVPLPPIYVQGMAPDVTIIPVKVLSDYHIGKSHLNPDYNEMHLVFGTDRAVAAGIIYATDLAIAGYRPMVITMSLGGPTPAKVIEQAIDRAIANGVIVVAAAGNEGAEGMGWPGAYPQVISVGASGWRYEWYSPGILGTPPAAPPPPRYRLWWLQDNTWGFNDIAEPTPATDVYITTFSSRQLSSTPFTDCVGPNYMSPCTQDLDVVAPGSWVRGPFPGDPGYNHLPWWSEGRPLGRPSGGSFFYVGGTSMAAPHVTSIVALMLEKNHDLGQSQVESILESSALSIAPGSMTIWDLTPAQGWYTYSWGSDATGAGLVQAKAAVDLTPP